MPRPHKWHLRPLRCNYWLADGVLLVQHRTGMVSKVVTVATAVAVAAQSGLPLHRVNIIPAEGLRPQADAFATELMNQAQQDGVVAKGEVRSGKPLTEILASVAKSGADLVVMGSCCDSRIGRALVGGVAQKGMGLSEHPVLVLHLQ